jgi:DNA-binding XRE family transcriptional regulator
MAVSDSTPLTGILGTLIPPEVAKDKQALVKWIYKVISDPDRPCDSASVDLRLMLIDHLQDLMRTRFANTADLRQHVDRFLDNPDGRRLPIPQAIKRARKRLGLTQRQLAEQLSLKDHTLISKFEKGKRLPTKGIIEWLKEGGM